MSHLSTEPSIFVRHARSKALSSMLLAALAQACSGHPSSPETDAAEDAPLSLAPSQPEADPSDETAVEGPPLEAGPESASAPSDLPAPEARAEAEYGPEADGLSETEVPKAAGGLATCTAHYANTATWMDCTGGSQKSWVRLRSQCKNVFNVCDWHSGDWKVMNAGQGPTTFRYECSFRACNAASAVRAY